MKQAVYESNMIMQMPHASHVNVTLWVASAVLFNSAG